MTKGHIEATGPEHEQFYQDLIKLVKKYTGELSSAEMLAVAANMLGKLAAMQDQRNMTESHAMEIIIHNFELGNKQVIDKLNRSKGNA